MLSRKDVNKMWVRFKMRARRAGLKVGFKRIEYFTPGRMQDIDVEFAIYYSANKEYLFPHILFDKTEGTIELEDIYLSNPLHSPKHFRKKPITVWSKNKGTLLATYEDINEASVHIGISPKQVERNAKLQNSHPRYFIRYGDPKLLIGVNDGELTVDNVKVGKSLLSLFIYHAYDGIVPGYGTEDSFEGYLRAILKDIYLHKLGKQSLALTFLKANAVVPTQKCVVEYIQYYMEVCNG